MLKSENTRTSIGLTKDENNVVYSVCAGENYP